MILYFSEPDLEYLLRGRMCGTKLLHLQAFFSPKFLIYARKFTSTSLPSSSEKLGQNKNIRRKVATQQSSSSTVGAIPWPC